MILKRLFKRNAPLSAKSDIQTAPMDHTMVLRSSDLAALRARIAAEMAPPVPPEPPIDPRIADLEALLNEKIVALESFRALTDANPKPAAPVKAAKRKAAAIKPPRPVKLTTLQFWALHGQAVNAIRAVYGDNWKVHAPFGETELVTVAHTRAKGERGIVLRWPADQRIPSARYWPNSVIPEGVTVNQDYARANPTMAQSKPRAARRDALERACLTYGPQPLTEIGLAEAAD